MLPVALLCGSITVVCVPVGARENETVEPNVPKNVGARDRCRDRACRAAPAGADHVTHVAAAPRRKGVRPFSSSPRSRFCVPALAACTEANPDELRAAANTLVPANGRVLARDEGACVQLASVTSCVELEHVVGLRSAAERVELVRAAARETEWEARGEETNARIALLHFVRGDYDATVTVLNDDWRARCKDPTTCGDSIRVVRR